MKVEEFPAEFFLPITGQEHLLGRLTINTIKFYFVVEIDIVQKESKKIWAHVDTLYQIEEFDEALDRGVWRLSEYFKN